MPQEHPFWQEWINILDRLGLQDLAIALLEGVAPLRIVLAQVVLAGNTLLGENPRVSALARLLDDSDDSRLFVAMLREESGA